MKSKVIVASLSLVGSLVGSPILATECDPPPVRPIKIKGAVCGTAFDLSGSTLAGADLELVVGQDGPVVATSHVDGNGHFTFPTVAEGTYYFHVQGFYISHGAVQVSGRQSKCGKGVIVTFTIGMSCPSALQSEDQRPGTLEISANVPYALVSIDGGESEPVDFDRPGGFDLEPGFHHVVVDGPAGYRLLRFRVKIRAGQTTTYRAILQRDPH